ncbi:MAG: type II toxin-antitoxin system prevent-host-death family antitoxin [Candidatus Devosia phytovorans]|uniref:Antitoxin n=1 Tax=Candidatus Devosia phytovorans TaxID=3121372 RepID=A0AAJ5VQW8_9HYPH|nr:type II toxin-antitoxin system prevent-host-death family antitoxin [Devosia sp.]WEK03101.1 MAG: type II toxin-antitoxin system prevent-host-death family antitoxin [Devosia sp.]
MDTINIEDADTNLSSLVEKAAQGEIFIIAKAGKPMAKVVPIDPPEEKKFQRIGFMEGQFNIPDDFDTMGQEEIEDMFYGKE